MSICLDCEREYGCKEGCIVKKHFSNGAWYDPVKVGDNGDCGEFQPSHYSCPDCGAYQGQYHHFNCDAERCPKCGEQLFSCGCFENEYSELCNDALKEIIKISKHHNISTNEIINILNERYIKYEE